MTRSLTLDISEACFLVMGFIFIGLIIGVAIP